MCSFVPVNVLEIRPQPNAIAIVKRRDFAVKKCILLVEDDPLISETVAALLSALGYSICATVDSGEEAVRAASAIVPDVILMDINLRGEMDGIEAAEIIRAAGNTPVIFMTANSDNHTRRRANSSRSSSFLSKPFHPDELSLMLESTFHGTS